MIETGIFVFIQSMLIIFALLRKKSWFIAFRFGQILFLVGMAIVMILFGVINMWFLLFFFIA